MKQQFIRFASFLGDNAFEFYQQVVAYLGDSTGLPTKMAVVPFAEQDRVIDTGQIEAAFSCGITYVLKSAQTSSPARLMAAPILSADRYHDRPVYFSDVIVRAGSSYHSFDDLRDTTFAYNDVGSFSGYVLAAHHLWTLEATMDYFGKTIRSGSHATSMNWVEAGEADCAAIDSVVLEMELAQRPERARSFRVLASLGPAAMPPVIATPSLSEEHCDSLARALTTMHITRRGQEILNGGGIRRFEQVTDDHYDDIRRMLQDLQKA
ncbi:MAG: PhnD/SsuA/transferrin family substrate-binding protein [Chloroflexi bacterium]|nr:PhnD/SsuA/transferrin family substrate-binding protein [Chloroflexota bacterium]